jgi:hypothetical protein
VKYREEGKQALMAEDTLKKDIQDNKRESKDFQIL